MSDNVCTHSLQTRVAKSDTPREFSKYLGSLKLAYRRRGRLACSMVPISSPFGEMEPGWNALSSESASRLQLQPLPHLTHLLAQRLQLGKPRHARLLRLAARATVHACVLHVLLQRGNLLVEQRKAGE